MDTFCRLRIYFPFLGCCIWNETKLEWNSGAAWNPQNSLTSFITATETFYDWRLLLSSSSSSPEKKIKHCAAMFRWWCWYAKLNIEIFMCTLFDRRWSQRLKIHTNKKLSTQQTNVRLTDTHPSNVGKLRWNWTARRNGDIKNITISRWKSLKKQFKKQRRCVK